MRASTVNDHGELTISEVPRPVPEKGEVLLRVVCAGVNRADFLQRLGKYPPPPGVTSVLGLEASGIVEELGPGVKGWNLGEEVFALLPGGGYGEYCIAESELLWRKPKDWSFEYAAAIPEGLMTAYLNLVQEGGLALGERVFIEGGSSGVGTFAIQIARRFGAYVVASAGGDERVKRVVEVGAHEGINHQLEELPKRYVNEGFDLILSIMGGRTFARNLGLLSSGGRLVIIATQGGAKSELDILSLMRKRLRIIGSVLRSRTTQEKVAIKRELDAALGEVVFSGGIRPYIDSVFPLEDAHSAHARMERGEHFGKIVLRIRSF